MKACATLFALLLTVQLLTPASVLAQTVEAGAAKLEDEIDARRLQTEYAIAARIDYRIPPYSVDIVTETSKTLADGNQIKTREASARYQAENGRLRYTIKSSRGQERIFIADIKARTGYLVRPDRHDVLRVSGAPAPLGYSSSAGGRSIVPLWYKEIQTNLGAKDFEGYKTAGTRKENYYAPGAKGNDKELVETVESWRSGEYNLNTYQRRYSPLSGEVVTRLENFKAGDPSDAWFTIPADYTVRDIVFDHAVPAP